MINKDIIKVSKEEDRQIFYNFVLTIPPFMAFLSVVFWFFWSRQGSSIFIFGMFDVLVITVASFRMIRGLTYDKAMCYVREYFQYDKERVEQDGKQYVLKKPTGPNLRSTIFETIDCLWCVGLWLTTFVIFMYYISPYTRFVVLVFAAAAVASIFQVFAKWLGAIGERTELETDALEGKK